MDDEEENEKENKPEAQSPFLMKKMEQLFLEKRAVYLWGVVDDKSARDIVAKLLLLDADKPGEEIKFFINASLLLVVLLFIFLVAIIRNNIVPFFC